MTEARPLDPALRAAWEATEYRFAAGEQVHTLRIGHSHADVDAWLAAQGAQAGAFLSNANPRGERLDERANARRTAALQRWLLKQGLAHWPGLGVPPAGSDWEAEPSFFVPGLDLERATGIARYCEQLGFVWHQVGQRSELRVVPAPVEPGPVQAGLPTGAGAEKPRSPPDA